MEIKSDAAPNVIVVTLAAPIEAASAYVVKYNEMSVEFVGVEAKPASIEITTTEATFGVETPVGIVARKESIGLRLENPLITILILQTEQSCSGRKARARQSQLFMIWAGMRRRA